MDLALSGILIVLLSPLYAVALVAIGLGRLRSAADRGPLLYRERRISKGREFELLKFRALRRDVLERAGLRGQEPRLLERDPSNLTWAGRRLLKPWYLDELPQLFNVLGGHMSLVGPRPWPPAMVREQVEAGHDYRNRVPAGWTGPVQVHKGLVHEDDYVALDLAYVDALRTRSALGLLRLDLSILARTLKVLVRREGLTY
jgi:lipopolysaccharide/colanic/teichoic acid biosynthesis glycosyltransferase